MEIRIGIANTPRELSFESEESAEAVKKTVTDALESGTSHLSFVDSKGNSYVVLAAIPRYHPSWAWWMVRVPGLREFLVSNLVVVLEKR